MRYFPAQPGIIRGVSDNMEIQMMTKLKIISAQMGIAVALAGLLLGTTAQAKTGWQKPGSFTFSEGETTQQIGMNCPTGLIAQNGAFQMNSVGQSDNVELTFNAPRYDESTPDYNSWGWHFHWPDGAAAGESATFDVYCVK
jgi:hypothetical protein